MHLSVNKEARGEKEKWEEEEKEEGIVWPDVFVLGLQLSECWMRSGSVANVYSSCLWMAHSAHEKGDPCLRQTLWMRKIEAAKCLSNAWTSGIDTCFA